MPRITVPACLEHLDSAKDYLKSHIPEKFKLQVDNVILVAEELLVNVFSYAYPEGANGEAQIALDVEEIGGEDKLVFCVKDWGAPFNPFEEVEDPDLTLDVDARPIGGLGIFLIKQVSEEQSWRFADNANCIRIVFGAQPKAC
ncbi:MAG: ATP-binding protein [Duodenibacillus sp.]|nr:ATP-binding protein [Duodenibacillus sp.]